jgi:hypothetical protein
MQTPSAPIQPRPKFRPRRLSPYVERRRDMAKLANMSAPLQPNIARFPSGTEPLRLHPYSVEPMRENLHCLGCCATPPNLVDPQRRPADRASRAVIALRTHL